MDEKGSSWCKIYLKNEREKSRVWLVVENREVFDEGFVVEGEKSSVRLFLQLGQVLERLSDDRLSAVLHQG